MKNILIIILLGISQSKNYPVTEDKNIRYCTDRISNKELPYKERALYGERLKFLLSGSRNDSLTREIYFSLANSYISMNDWRRLREILKIIENKAKNNCYHLAETYRMYGELYENESMNDSSYYYYSKSLKIYKSLYNTRKICDLYRSQSRIQYFYNDYLQSDQTLIKALKIAKAENLHYQLFDIYCGLGINSNELGDYDQSTKYYYKAIKVLDKFDDKIKTRLMFEGLNYLGNNYLKQHDFFNAKTIYLLSLSMFDENDHSFVLYGTLLDNLGYLKLNDRKYLSAKKILLKAASIRDSLSIEQGRNFNRLYLSQYYAAVKDTTQAIKYAKEALRLSQDFKAPNDMLVCLKQLLLVDKDHALDYSKDYIRISDSMQKLERVTRNKFAKIAYETEEITQEKDRAETQRSFFLTLAILVTAFGLLLGIIFYQRAKQKELVFAQNQQQAKEEIYELIQDRQTKLDQGRQIEKKRIARELHDGIMNKLASTRFNLYAIKNNNDPETIKKCLSYIDNIQEIEKEIRDISHDLTKEQFLEKDSFKRILTTFFDEQQAVQEAKLHIDIEKSIDWETIESNKKINLYRILQEALLNIQKHAQAQHVFIHITQTEAGLHVEIHDDGKGYSEADNAIGIGLQNIKTRVKDCLGFFKMKSQPGKGTSLDINFPLSKNLS